MFTGIVESTGLVTDAAPSEAGRRLRVDAGSIAGACKPGDSISVSGVCLTVAEVARTTIAFDVIGETLARSTLGTKGVDSRVNLEQSLRVGDRLDGHFVQGHVDGTARVDAVVRSPGEYVLWLRPPEALRLYIVPKGSIAIDGVSMTIASIRGPLFSVALIPTTLERTTLGSVQEGDTVNLETDVIVRTIVHRLSPLGEGRLPPSGLQKVGTE